MTEANGRLPGRAGDIDRLRRLFADAFGTEVLHELPLRLRALRQRATGRPPDPIGIAPSRPPSRT